MKISLLLALIGVCVASDAAWAELPKKEPSKESPYKRYEHVQKSPTGLETLHVDFEEDRGVKHTENIDYIEPSANYQKKMIEDVVVRLKALEEKLADVEARLGRLEESAPVSS